MISSNLRHCLVKSPFIEGRFLHLSCISLSNKKSDRNPQTKSASQEGINVLSISKLFTTSSAARSSNSESECPERKWISVNSIDKTDKKATKFSVVSYNILSQFYVHLHQNLYASNDPAYMQWQHRLNALKSEIFDLKPDILCLQEVQNNHLDAIKEELKALNFGEPLYKKRNGSQVDGCAIFFNRNLFDLVECHYVEYYQPNVRILNRCNVAVIAKLALKANPKVQFVVSTTHLLFNPRRHDIRLAQVQLLLAELDRIAHNYETQSTDKSIPIILTGDFNLQQDSQPYRLLVGETVNIANVFKSVFQVKGTLLPMELGITDNCQHYHVVAKNRRDQTALYNSSHSSLAVNDDRKAVLSRNPTKPILRIEELMNSGLAFKTGTLKNDLNLGSTLGLYNDQNKLMASTYHHGWIKVDYMFYSKSKPQNNAHSHFKLLETYQLPSVEKCIETGLIPNRLLGSDHYPMAARFAIIDNK